MFTWPPQEVFTPNTVTGHMTETYGLRNTHTDMSTCSTFLTPMLSPGSPGRFGNHSELCSQGSNNLYPPVFVKALLNKSIRNRRHRVGLPSVGTQMAWPGFQTYTHIMIGLYRY